MKHILTVAVFMDLLVLDECQCYIKRDITSRLWAKVMSDNIKPK